MINLLINNVEVSVLPNTSVLKACEIAGFEVPRFCYHKRLSVAGNCRMCLVEVAKSPKPVVACAMPVMRGMVIFTDTPLVKKARENVLEFLLENHPLDCPICDQGGECDLQDQTMAFGSDKTRFYGLKRGVLDKNIGPLIKTIMTRCIHCTRCVRFGEEIAGIEDLGTTIRGTKTEIGTYLEKIFKTELSGNVIDLCPVGALTSKPYAFTARPWELKTDFMVDICDGLGNKVKIDLKDNKIVRVSPFYLNTELSNLDENPSSFRDFWISDKTRFSYEGLSNQFTTYIGSKSPVARVSPDLDCSAESKKIFREAGVHVPYDIFSYEKSKITSYHTNLEQISSYKDSCELVSKRDSFLNLVKASINFKEIHSGSSAISIICGYNADMGTLQSTKDLACFLNNKVAREVCSVFSSRDFYAINGIKDKFAENSNTNISMNDLETVDFCLLVGVNPRYDASLYNLHLRKRFLQGGLKIASIGAPLNLTYPVTHLGANLETLKEISRFRTDEYAPSGRFGPFQEEWMAAKNPMVLIGSDLLESDEYFKIKESVSRLVTLNKATSYNVLQKQANQLGVISLGVTGLKLSSSDFKTASVLYLVEVDPKEVKLILEHMVLFCEKGKYPTIIIQGPRFNFDTFTTNLIDFIIPTKSHVEKEKSSFLNTFGLLQKNLGSTSISSDRNLLSGSQVLSKVGLALLSKFSSVKKLSLDKKIFSSFLLGFSFNDRVKILTPRLLERLNSFRLPFSEKKAKLWSSSVEDFYLTDGISSASPIMGKCSIVNRSKSTSFDF